MRSRDAKICGRPARWPRYLLVFLGTGCSQSGRPAVRPAPDEVVRSVPDSSAFRVVVRSIHDSLSPGSFLVVDPRVLSKDTGVTDVTAQTLARDESLERMRHSVLKDLWMPILDWNAWPDCPGIGVPRVQPTNDPRCPRHSLVLVVVSPPRSGGPSFPSGMSSPPTPTNRLTVRALVRSLGPMGSSVAVIDFELVPVTSGVQIRQIETVMFIH